MPVSRHPLWLNMLAFAAPAVAQDAARPAPAADDDIVVTAREYGGDCIVTDGRGERRLLLDCLTRSLASDDTPGAPTKGDPAAVAGRAPPSRTGTFSHSATAQRMGNNFGRSARPQRPAPPVFAPPLRGPQ